ncbi:hypothetical protein GW17_00045245 [Ensete ventricosum]|nr:hypothetical protein GW17_00045245 [Ensete ventricosum]
MTVARTWMSLSVDFARRHRFCTWVTTTCATIASMHKHHLCDLRLWWPLPMRNLRWMRLLSARDCYLDVVAACAQLPRCAATAYATSSYARPRLSLAWPLQLPSVATMHTRCIV